MQCRAEPITASLIQNSWVYSGGGNPPISSYFESLNNVETYTTCEPVTCFIEVIGVADHSSCVTQVTGYAVSYGSASVSINTNLRTVIVIGDIDTWNEGQAVYINISCTP